MNEKVRQDLGFRADEAARLFELVKSAESASIVGVSGVGKSNLFHHLLDPVTQQKYLEGKANQYLFVRVNFHYIPDMTARSVYSVIMEQFEMLHEHAARLGLPPETFAKIEAYHTQLLAAKEDVLVVRRYFHLAIRELLKQPERKLIFIFDQFDDLYQSADSQLFSNLRGLREGYKYRIAYLVFTRNALDLLMPQIDRPRDEFWELLATNVIGLQPYGPRDAVHMLQRIAARNQHLQFDQLWLTSLLLLTGGHAGLLRATFITAAQEQMSAPTPHTIERYVEKLLQFEAIYAECEKIFVSQTLAEQEALRQLAMEQNWPIDQNTLRQLQLKGLVRETPPTLFATLFAHYIRSQEGIWQSEIRLDELTQTVSIEGYEVETLTRDEYRFFYRLYRSHGEVVPYKEMIAAVFPAEEAQTAYSKLRRVWRTLRLKLEPDPRKARYIEHLSGRGYRLRR